MTQSDAGVASLTPTKITPAELDAFSAAQVQGSFQQTSQMAAMGAFNDAFFRQRVEVAAQRG